MRTVVLGEPPPEVEAWLDRRRALIVDPDGHRRVVQRGEHGFVPTEGSALLGVTGPEVAASLDWPTRGARSPTDRHGAHLSWRPIAGHPDLHAPSPASRLVAARAATPRQRRRLERDLADWPALSPGAANAWLLMVTTNPPAWRDPLLAWPERSLSLGEPHEGFFYPDPLGFWAEVRRWATVLLRRLEPGWATPEALAVTALVHVGDDPERLTVAVQQCQPGAVLFLDEPSWRSAGWEVQADAHHIPDPHRPGVVYQGFWGRRPDGSVVGKSPQHPASHRLYRAADMDGFLRAAPF